MRLAIMQPYFFPYIGYFQLIAAVDQFVVYDDIQYTKRGWINRNRFLQNGKEATFSLPLKSDSQTAEICRRELAENWNFSRKKLLLKFKANYRLAPYFESTFLLIEEIVSFNAVNLFHFLHNSLVKICAHLGITTKIIVSSEIVIAPHLRSQDKILALCTAAGANTYINAIGGMELYAKKAFQEKGIALKFIRSKPFEYPQFEKEFVPWLSIIDVMMFTAPEKIGTAIQEGYELV